MLTVDCPGCGHPVPTTGDGRCANCGRTVALDRAPAPAATAADTLTQVPARPDAPTLTYAGGPAKPTRNLPGRTATIPGYQIESELGRGGMGVVYLARELSLNRPVALKVLLAGTHAGSRDLARFNAEAEAAAAVRHSNVVEVYAVGQHAGLPYIALELIPGGSLDDRLAAGPLAPAEAARVVLGIARGVQEAHDRGVVHRDLKPSNVLFGPNDQPKVTDFGLAKLGDTGITTTGAVMGTPAYMAPEQARGDTKASGPPVDVWALGAILYECLTGRPPFLGESAPETLRLVCEADPPPVRRGKARVPKDLETIAAKCLEKDPARRYASAGAVADDLARYLAGEPVVARPRGPVVRLARWVGRHRGPVHVGAGALFAAIISLITLSLVSKPKPVYIPPKAELPADLALIPPDAFAVLCVRPGDISKDPSLTRLGIQFAGVPEREVKDVPTTDDAFAHFIGLRPSDVERVTLIGRDPTTLARQGTPEFLVVLSTRSLVDVKTIREKLAELFGTFDPQDYQGRRIYTARSTRTPVTLFKAGERELAFGTTTEIQAAITRLVAGSAKEPASPTQAAILEGHTFVFGGRPAGVAEFVFGPGQAADPRLPPLIARAVDHFRKADSAIVTIDLLPSTPDCALPGLDVVARVRFASNEAAGAARTPIHDALLWLSRSDEKPAKAGPAVLLPPLRRAAKEARVNQEGQDVVVTGGPRFTAAELAAAAKPPILSNELKLKQIGLALHSYSTTHGHFPPAVIRAADGKPLRSWRVELLPFLEEDQLYRRLKLDEPWDSSHNKPLLEKAPTIFAMDQDDLGWFPSHTRFQVPVGKGSVFDESAKFTFADIRDGTSETAFVIEAGDAVHWAEPKDFVFVSGQPVPHLGEPSSNTFLVLMGDASVKPLPRTVPSAFLGAIITRDGGELVDWKTFKVTIRAK
jgi:serine/threonine protein kinase